MKIIITIILALLIYDVAKWAIGALFDGFIKFIDGEIGKQ